MANEGIHSKQKESARKAMEELVLAEHSYFIASNYRRMLEATDRKIPTHECIKLFEYGMRFVTLGILNQYIPLDIHEIYNPDLHREFNKKKLADYQPGKQDFLELIIRYFFILDLGEMVFSVSQDTPSRQLLKGVKIQ
jgi:hypothetical protein